ncbi:MAG: FAD-binding oxidoreductase [Candidatus Pacebacteria bacterium]|nr:FAD-binding oxidoreductase [Candidatus Paceibacterota bacterium]
MGNKLQNTATLVNRVVHNEKYIQCTFELEESFSQRPQAGQYVSFRLGERKEIRSYSICSMPSDSKSFDLMVDVTPQGIGTTFLQNAEIGTQVELLGPLGRFVLSEGIENKKVFLIGTGSGVAPLRAMVLDLLRNRKTTQQVTLMWGERFSQNLIWQDEMKELESKFPNFKFIPVISRPAETDQCAKGRVTGCIDPMHLTENTEYYLCGGKAMIEETMEILQKKWVDRSVIFHEKFD